MQTNTTKELSQLSKQLGKVPGLISALQENIKATEKRMVELEKAGLIYASIHWRNEKYMLLVYPMKNGERPNPTYIGSDPDRIQEAKEGIARAEEFDELKKVHEQYARSIRDAKAALQNLQRALDYK